MRIATSFFPKHGIGLGRAGNAVAVRCRAATVARLEKIRTKSFSLSELDSTEQNRTEQNTHKPLYCLQRVSRNAAERIVSATWLLNVPSDHTNLSK